MKTITWGGELYVLAADVHKVLDEKTEVEIQRGENGGVPFFYDMCDLFDELGELINEQLEAKDSKEKQVR